MWGYGAVLAVAVALSACGSVKQCEIGETLCGDACVVTVNDNQHCGRCDNPCEPGLICGNGTCAAGCPPGQTNCNGTCVDTLTDPAHCGSCTTPCDTTEECRAGSCEIPCAAMLSTPIDDPWGMSWDGLERTAATLDAAQIACEAFGGRLPTATELYRVSSTQSGAVGMAFHTNPLWSIVPAGRLDQIAVRLSDGVASASPAASAITYRCVCAPPPAATFSGARCAGPATAPCFTSGRFNIDAADRPALRKSAAIWECAHEHAHLADTTALIEAIQAGLTGSGTPVMTADRAQYDSSTTVTWTNGTWVANGSIGAAPVSTLVPFRCIGTSFGAGTHPNPIPGEFVGPDGGFKSEAADTPPSSFQIAGDACTARGGHMPRSVELAELIMLGLPAGSGTYMWTSDQCGSNGSQFLVAALRWNGLDQRFPYEYGPAATTTLDWTYKHSGLNALRCIYYPLDAMFTIPTTCNGGCFLVTLPGATPAVMYFDSTDRTAALPAAAFDACRREGGHLASERDLTEAIRAGLPNGVGGATYVWTSEVTRQNHLDIVRWTNVDTAFSDLWTTYMTWETLNVPHQFRCMWTNELR